MRHALNPAKAPGLVQAKAALRSGCATTEIEKVWQGHGRSYPRQTFSISPSTCCRRVERAKSGDDQLSGFPIHLLPSLFLFLRLLLRYWQTRAADTQRKTPA